MNPVLKVKMNLKILAQFVFLNEKLVGHNFKHLRQAGVPNYQTKYPSPIFFSEKGGTLMKISKSIFFLNFNLHLLYLIQ